MRTKMQNVARLSRFTRPIAERVTFGYLPRNGGPIVHVVEQDTVDGVMMGWSSQ